MKCPVDNATLVMSDRQGVEIDYCPECRGVWLDRGELDKIIDRSAAESAPAPAPAREAQRGAYTQIAPLTLDVDPDEAFELARKAAVNRKWQIVEAIRPGGRVGNGRIEAVAHSLLLNLPADITVRVRPRADGARIDVRSATRLGTRDLGDNADRIRAYLDEVANLAIALK